MILLLKSKSSIRCQRNITYNLSSDQVRFVEDSSKSSYESLLGVTPLTNHKGLGRLLIRFQISLRLFIVFPFIEQPSTKRLLIILSSSFDSCICERSHSEKLYQKKTR